MSFSYVALQRMQRLAPDVRLVMLIDKSRNWPMLKPVLEDDWMLGPGHRLPDPHPGSPRSSSRPAASSTCGR